MNTQSPEGIAFPLPNTGKRYLPFASRVFGFTSWLFFPVVFIVWSALTFFTSEPHPVWNVVAYAGAVITVCFSGWLYKEMFISAPIERRLYKQTIEREIVFGRESTFISIGLLASDLTILRRARKPYLEIANRDIKRIEPRKTTGEHSEWFWDIFIEGRRAPYMMALEYNLEHWPELSRAFQRHVGIAIKEKPS